MLCISVTRARFNAFEDLVQVQDAQLSFFMVRNMVQTRTILALYSTAGANLVKKFNDFRWTNSLTSRGNAKRNDNLFAPKN